MHVHLEGRPDQNLSCLYSSHSRFRCITTAVLGPNLSGTWDLISVEPGTWPQWNLGPDLSGPVTMSGLRVIRVNWRHTHSYRGNTNSANNSILFEIIQQVKGNTKDHIHRWTAPEEKYSVTSIPVVVLQFQLSCTTDQNHGLETDPQASKPTTWEQIHTWQGSDNHKAKGEAPHSI